MKRLFSFFLLFATFLSPTLLFAGDKVTAHYKVNGVCEQCKARIEKAAYEVKGVKYADWNVDSHDFTVKYDTEKTSPEAILKAIADAGHDNELFKSTDDTYNNLHSCCHYRTVKKKS